MKSTFHELEYQKCCGNCQLWVKILVPEPWQIIAKQDLHQRAIVAMIYEQRREQTVNLVFLLQTLYHHINHLFLS